MEGISHAVSEVPAEAGAGQGALVVPEAFSFAWFEALIAQHTPPDDDESLTTKPLGYAFVAVVLFGVLGAVAALLLRNQLGMRLLQMGIVLQWLCIALSFVHIGWQAWRAYQRQHADFALNLDQQWVTYDTIVNSVRSYPLAALSPHLRYVRDRKSRLIYRAGLFSGGFDKLGVLPLLLAMYLQFKDWPVSNWRSLLDSEHWLGIAILPFVVATYVVSWWAARAKGRLDLYEMLLTEASIREEAEQKEQEGIQR